MLFNRSNAYRNVQKLTPILENVLDKELVLPDRKINSLEELFEIFSKLRIYSSMGLKRPIQRPKNHEKQKKRHTRKNLIISDENRRIGYLSPRVEGKSMIMGYFQKT